MKKIIVGMVALLLLSSSALVLADSTNNRGNENTTPSEVLDSVVSDANKQDKVINTTVGITDKTGQFDSKYKIANTLDSIRKAIVPYLDWFLYIGLSVATVLIIITGLQLVTSASSGMENKKARTKIKNIAIGVAILTGFYIIIQLFMAIIAYFLGG